MDRASFTSVIDTPDIIHAQQMKNIVSQVHYQAINGFPLSPLVTSNDLEGPEFDPQ